MKSLQKITIVFSIPVILFGFYQLSYEQEIFAKSLAPCCNNGQCEGENCISPSSINAGSLCDSYMLT